MSEQPIPQALELRGITRNFADAGGVLEVLKGVNLTLKPGEAVALVGPTGAGKSTLLHIAGLLEQATDGALVINGQEVARLSEARRTALRLSEVGFVYQFHHLLPEFSALENVAMPGTIAGEARKHAHARAEELLTAVGLAERLNHRPSQLSGGEQQRVAIARALANKPSLLLADEPTGNLDQETGDAVFDMLASLVRDQGLAALIATHDRRLAAKLDRVVTLDAGKLVELSTEPTPEASI
ncbi:MAG: ABC transporter ATP-binding protein [Pseudomonadota bacterium]